MNQEMLRRAWLLAILVLCVSSRELEDVLSVAFVRPPIASLFERSIDIVLKQNREITSLMNNAGGYTVLVQLSVNRVVYGRARQTLNPIDDAIRLTIPISDNFHPLPIGELAGVAYVTPSTDTSWAQRIAVARFKVRVKNHAIDTVSLLPKRLTSATREVAVDCEYTAVSASGADLVLVAFLRDVNKVKLGTVTTTIPSGRHQISVRVPLRPGLSFAFGEAQLVMFISPTSDVTWAARLTTRIVTLEVLPAEDKIHIASIEPSNITDATEVVAVRVGINSFSYSSGFSGDSKQAPLQRDMVVNLQDSAGAIVGTGFAQVPPDARYATVSVPVTKALLVGQATVVAFVTARSEQTRATVVAEARRSIIVNDGSITGLTIIRTHPETLTDGVDSVSVSVRYSITATRISPDNDFILMVMVTGDGSKYGFSSQTIDMQSGSLTLSIPVDSARALPKAHTPLAILAFLAPSRTPRYANALVTARAVLPRQQSPTFDVLGAVVYTRNDNGGKPKVYVSARLRYRIGADIDGLAGLSHVSISLLVQFDGVTKGHTYIVTSTSTSDLVDLEIEIDGGTPQPEAELGIIVLLYPEDNRVFSARLKRTAFKIGAVFPQVDTAQHRIAIAGSLQQSLYATDEFVVLYVEYSVEGLAALFPSGLSDISPGLFSIQISAFQGAPRKLIGGTVVNPMSLSGTVPITVEFSKNQRAGPVLFKAYLDLEPELLARAQSTVNSGRERRLSADDFTLQIATPTQNFVQVMRSVPETIASDQESFGIDVMFDVTDGCPTPAQSSLHSCMIKVKVFSNAVVVGVGNFLVQQLTRSVETVNVNLRTSLEAGSSVQIVAKAILTVGSSTRNVAVAPRALLNVTSGERPCAPGQGAQQKKNILFIMVDDLGTQIGAYGDTTAVTPNIDAIAARGILFDRQFVDQPTCIPARAAMLTGLRTTRTGQLFGLHTFRKMPGIQSAAEIFMKAGYSTYTFGKVFHFRTEYAGTTAGFNGP